MPSIDSLPTSDTRSPEDEPGDLGLGDKVAQHPGTRLINTDGTFNVVRRGRSGFAPYQNLVEMSWPRFIGLTLLLYLGCNLFFAVGFYLIGPDEISGIEEWDDGWEQFLGCLYLSVQTFTTVGYGSIAPISVLANAWAGLLALFGWIALALMTGLFFARFSRPSRMIAFSEFAIVTGTDRTKRSLQFRIANKRDNNLINLRARMVLTYLKDGNASARRHFHPLELERDFVPLFPLNWTVVHYLDEDSPVRQWSEEDFRAHHAELLVIVEGYDRTFAQPIFITNSYTCDEIRWRVRFAPMYAERASVTELFLGRINAVTPLGEEE